jgi:2-polyprenyl-3-methyl-5-hydroxy-6-metoxy-1,4-benzoquinol methylase
VSTCSPVAVTSKDHLFPKGTKHAFSCPEFIADLDGYFQRPFSLLDLGCAGGGLVADALAYGVDAIGIDGSDWNIREGTPIWAMHQGTRLFTADLAEPWRVFRADKPATFDVVCAWELLEHLKEKDLPLLMLQILAHLAPGGLFIGSAATCHDRFKTVGKVDMHETVRPGEWWESFLSQWLENLDPCPVYHWMMQEQRPRSMWFCMRRRES